MSEFIAAIVGAAVGAWLAHRFSAKQATTETRSARRLAWLEHAQTQLLTTAGEVQNARAADIAGVGAKEAAAAWTVALRSIGELRRLEIEAEAYLASEGAEAIAEAARDIVSLTHLASSGGTAQGEATRAQLFNIVAKLLYHAASRIAGEIRGELGLDELGREWRLYDAELRQLRHELQADHPDLVADSSKKPQSSNANVV